MKAEEVVILDGLNDRVAHVVALVAAWPLLIGILRQYLLEVLGPLASSLPSFIFGVLQCPLMQPLLRFEVVVALFFSDQIVQLLDLIVLSAGEVASCIKIRTN